MPSTDRLDALFKGAPLVPVPWPRAPISRHRRSYDPVTVALAVGNPDRYRLDELDPNQLFASQPSITRAGVAFYLTNTYYLTGQTYADQHVASNRIPLVLTRDGSLPLILAGHHRAAAALVKNKPLLAIHMHGGWGPKR